VLETRSKICCDARLSSVRERASRFDYRSVRFEDQVKNIPFGTPAQNPDTQNEESKTTVAILVDLRNMQHCALKSSIIGPNVTAMSTS
jgi:hypothetical protein